MVVELDIKDIRVVHSTIHRQEIQNRYSMACPSELSPVLMPLKQAATLKQWSLCVP